LAAILKELAAALRKQVTVSGSFKLSETIIETLRGTYCEEVTRDYSHCCCACAASYGSNVYRMPADTFVAPKWRDVPDLPSPSKSSEYVTGRGFASLTFKGRRDFSRYINQGSTRNATTGVPKFD
jgi:hypothetical protein